MLNFSIKLRILTSFATKFLRFQPLPSDIDLHPQVTLCTHSKLIITPEQPRGMLILTRLPVISTKTKVLHYFRTARTVSLVAFYGVVVVHTAIRRNQYLALSWLQNSEINKHNFLWRPMWRHTSPSEALASKHNTPYCPYLEGEFSNKLRE